MTKKRIAEIEQTLPQNLDAEKGVLGAILIHNDAFAHVAPILSARDFFRDAHQRIFAVIEGLLERPGGSADFVSIVDALARRGDLEDVGGRAYLASLTDGVPRSSNVREYARIVKEKSQLRALVYAANAMLTDAYVAEDPVPEILARADAAIVQLQHGQTGRMQTLAASAGGMLDYLEHRVTHRTELTGVDTGFQSVNDLTMGWQAGDMVVLAARPSVGKTAFALNTVVAAARTVRPDGSPRRVAVFSLEMKRRQLELRVLSALSGVALSTIQGGWITDAQWPAISQAVQELGDLQIHIDDTAARTEADIRASTRQMRAEHGLDLVVVDYVQLMSSTLQRRGSSRNEEVTYISRKLKVLADELAAPILVLSQLTREAANAEPELSHLRESGSLEQDADLVCFLHRRDHKQGGATRFIVAKQRNGDTGPVTLTFERETQRFQDGGFWSEPVKPAAPSTPVDKQAAKVRAIIRQNQRKSDRETVDV